MSARHSDGSQDGAPPAPPAPSTRVMPQRGAASSFAADKLPSMSARQPPTKRKRVSRACARCRSRKQRCSGTQPCDLCVSADVKCTFPPATRTRGASPRNSSRVSSAAAVKIKNLANENTVLRLLLGAQPQPFGPLTPGDLMLLDNYMKTTNAALPLLDGATVQWYAASRETWSTPSDSAAFGRACVLASMAWACLRLSLDHARNFFFRARSALGACAGVPVQPLGMYAVGMMVQFSGLVMGDPYQEASLKQLLTQWLDASPSVPFNLAFSAGFCTASITDDSSIPARPDATRGLYLGRVLGTCCLLLTGHALNPTQRLLHTAKVASPSVMATIARLQGEVAMQVPVMAFVHAVLSVEAKQQGKTDDAARYALEAFNAASHIFSANVWSPQFSVLAHAIASSIALVPELAAANSAVQNLLLQVAHATAVPGVPALAAPSMALMQAQRSVAQQQQQQQQQQWGGPAVWAGQGMAAPAGTPNHSTGLLNLGLTVSTRAATPKPAEASAAAAAGRKWAVVDDDTDGPAADKASAAGTAPAALAMKAPPTATPSPSAVAAAQQHMMPASMMMMMMPHMQAHAAAPTGFGAAAGWPGFRVAAPPGAPGFNHAAYLAQAAQAHAAAAHAQRSAAEGAGHA